MTQLRSRTSPDALGASDLFDTQMNDPGPVRPGTFWLRCGGYARSERERNVPCRRSAPGGRDGSRVHLRCHVVEYCGGNQLLELERRQPGNVQQHIGGREVGKPDARNVWRHRHLLVRYGFELTPTEQNALASRPRPVVGRSENFIFACDQCGKRQFHLLSPIKSARRPEWGAFERSNSTTTTVNSSSLGQFLNTGTFIAIDTSVAGFGPIGAPFSTGGGYPWQTLVHEEGHLIGLGHDGPYNGNVVPATPCSSPASACCPCGCRSGR
jgi:hypothetical protein